MAEKSKKQVMWFVLGMVSIGVVLFPFGGLVSLFLIGCGVLAFFLLVFKLINTSNTLALIAWGHIAGWLLLVLMAAFRVSG